VAISSLLREPGAYHGMGPGWSRDAANVGIPCPTVPPVSKPQNVSSDLKNRTDNRHKLDYCLASQLSAAASLSGGERKELASGRMA